ncbi:kynurenine/alpha-aminoadipate aminotransferase, mitochondrial-like [Chrysoperla carnea]|uniref:kynurenine/alpha-aminoadipate aminotransferase, mitochondrial-like n=1 Tax=Chrysoperla carnea TaxID=189513 RepID=UPI001D074634|nr:kynurenine/alpha-aminoadipate aminotransferase, mitochondrial-like [Chrysoperla carnea]
MELSTINYSKFINTVNSRRRPMITRELTKQVYNATGPVISLAEGMPNAQTFPFDSINFSLKDGSSFSIEGEELDMALQYLPTQGHPKLIKCLKDFHCRIHRPPVWHRSDLIITNGSQEGISRVIEMCIEEGDSVIVQNPLYSGTAIILNPYKPELIPIDQDEFGIKPTMLRRVLKQRKKLSMTNKNIKMPKLMYLNPTGANPTGTVMTLERKQAVYKIACEYNILILEDEAYQFLHFMEHIPPSFQSMDTEGRVLRFDSLSKIVSSGLRIGWVSGPKELIHAIELQMQAGCLHPSSLSQTLAYKLLNHWGYDGFMARMESIQDYYRVRRDITIAAMERHLTGLCYWSVPDAGMFVWIEVLGLTDVYDMLMTFGIKKGIVFVPGHAFMADSDQACNFIRASFSKVDPEKIDSAMASLAQLIREEQERLRLKLENCT